jgi:hypothetical protein
MSQSDHTNHTGAGTCGVPAFWSPDEKRADVIIVQTADGRDTSGSLRFALHRHRWRWCGEVSTNTVYSLPITYVGLHTQYI